MHSSADACSSAASPSTASSVSASLPTRRPEKRKRPTELDISQMFADMQNAHKEEMKAMGEMFANENRMFMSNMNTMLDKLIGAMKPTAPPPHQPQNYSSFATHSQAPTPQTHSQAPTPQTYSQAPTPQTYSQPQTLQPYHQLQTQHATAPTQPHTPYPQAAQSPSYSQTPQIPHTPSRKPSSTPTRWDGMFNVPDLD